MTESYEDRVAGQIEQYRTVENMHDLPDIFHYWSNKHLRPRLNEVCQADGVIEFFAKPLIGSAAKEGASHFLSVGSGDCGIEVEVAKSLIAQGCTDFVLECLELSEFQIERANRYIEGESLSNHVKVFQADINAWRPSKPYAGVMANQSLHHFVELERLFQTIGEAIGETGVFVTSDVIGRNGHMRWPEVLEIIDKIWAFLPKNKRYNYQLSRMEETFVNWDCSVDGFEGIRAQDIQKLLVENFKFESYLAYGGIIDMFVSRAYGHNYDPNSPEDLALIDFIQYLDDASVDAGRIKPTNILAVMRPKSFAGFCRQWRHWGPEYCIRKV